MRIALIADTFPPQRTSGAVQLRDLVREFARQGHHLTVLLPAPDLAAPWKMDDFDGVEVLWLKAPRTKDIGYLRRALAEFAMPFVMRTSLAKSPLANVQWDGVIWYSPSIFFGPLVRSLRAESGCKSYLIIRDIFPQWAADMGLMRRGPAYYLLHKIAQFQYSVADVIGVQTPGNLAYFTSWMRRYPDRHIQVLANWLGAPGALRSTIDFSQTTLKGRKIFVYAGNMGVAQNMDVIVELANFLRHDTSIGFALVGRGSERMRLEAVAASMELDNLLCFNEIDPDEIPSLYAQATAGIVTLDPRHRSHNIPGKFISYMQCGLPVLANVNQGNDLVSLINECNVGVVAENAEAPRLSILVNKLLSCIDDEVITAERCQSLFARDFAVEATVETILEHLQGP
ncbi:glycosyltransferase family 4 protein [Qipengyuania sp. DGS5-3]|uniref:glycosyltransferase family 4 protein n=1 Tax=Qipengyuania sp. DGS5-3 TaxID=3349632 RepID=UPI0036D2D325